jgi:hypothetical protein
LPALQDHFVHDYGNGPLPVFRGIGVEKPGRPLTKKAAGANCFDDVTMADLPVKLASLNKLLEGGALIRNNRNGL